MNKYALKMMCLVLLCGGNFPSPKCIFKTTIRMLIYALQFNSVLGSLSLLIGSRGLLQHWKELTGLSPTTRLHSNGQPLALVFIQNMELFLGQDTNINTLN